MPTPDLANEMWPYLLQESDANFAAWKASQVENTLLYEYCEKLGLPLLTQRRLRRTFQDLARAAEIDALVKKSICRRATDEMSELYSTISPAEQRQTIAKVIQLFGSGGATSEASGTFCGNLTGESGTQNETAG